MATGRNDEEEAEKAYELAENRFRANDIAGALHAAREARRHAGDKWYAILAVGDDSSATTSSGTNGAAAVITHEDLKHQYHRLCLLLHPDKNAAAAAEGAFKLLREVWDNLSLLHPPGSAASPPVSCPPPPPPPPPGPRRISCRKCRGSFFTVVGDVVSGVNCVHCNRWVSLFPCPARCARCGVRFTETVSTGTRLLRCAACERSSYVFVKNPYCATSWITGSSYRLKCCRRKPFSAPTPITILTI
ncbi:uncharacterized protein LOC127766459 [Oryza glaberrima]|uniref:uncharacterized protein LOC127766459 n=1 Tax=Oryza glaberrima TaxID=4538 RepID=UPI00224C5752|nr:uncharacterized protein LOC127766459 [Oryza glaberrima]